MTRALRIPAPCLLVFSLFVAADEAPAPRVTDLGWLAGCWSMRAGEREVLEQWMKPAGTTTLGMSRTTGPGGTTEYEFLLVTEQDGTLVLTARPARQPEASFRMKSSGPHEIVFENPEHDFPQRIGYRRDADDRLVAWIEGRRGERERRIEYPYERTACE